MTHKMCHQFLVVTVQKMVNLKSVYIYRSYRKIKTGIRRTAVLDHWVGSVASDHPRDMSEHFGHIC